MAYDSLGVANALLDQAKAQGKMLDPLQLQKLLYFAHGWHLALTKKPLLDEFIEAWTYGPVVPNVYHAFKICGSGYIKGRARSQTDPESTAPRPDDHFVIALLDRIIETYGDKHGLDLVKMTHTENSPWAKTLRANAGLHGADIKNEDIQSYFEQLMETSRAS